MAEPVRIEDKVIGQIENGIFTKRVQGSKHMLYTPRAWCIDQAVWLNIRGRVRIVRIEDTETGFIYEISTDEFCRVAKVFNRGFGVQYMVLMKYWRRNDDKQGLPF